MYIQSSKTEMKFWPCLNSLKSFFFFTWHNRKYVQQQVVCIFSHGRAISLLIAILKSQMNPQQCTVFWESTIFLLLLIFSIFSIPLLPFPSLPSRYIFLLQLGLWSRQCLRLSLRGTPLSCTATWLVTPLRRSSGGMLRSTELTPSSSCGTEPAGVGYPSTRPTAPMGSVCSVSRASHWRTLGPMSAGPATTPGAMTFDKTLPSRGSAPRPPFRCYRVSGLCPVVPRWWTNYQSPVLTTPTRKKTPPQEPSQTTTVTG